MGGLKKIVIRHDFTERKKEREGEREIEREREREGGGGVGVGVWGGGREIKPNASETDPISLHSTVVGRDSVRFKYLHL